MYKVRLRRTTAGAWQGATCTTTSDGETQTKKWDAHAHIAMIILYFVFIAVGRS